VEPIAWDVDARRKKMSTTISDYVPFGGYAFQTFDQTPFSTLSYPTQPQNKAPASPVQNAYGTYQNPAQTQTQPYQSGPTVEELYSLFGKDWER
jgi:hypothetical protein